MSTDQLASLSNTLFSVAFFTYLAAMVAYFFRMAFTRVTVEGMTNRVAAGRRIGLLGTALASAGVAVHAGSVLTRAFAAGGRMPLGNMYEYSSAMALFAVAIGLVVVQRRMGLGHLMGFVISAAVLMMTSAILLYSEAGPLVPALQSYWLKIHVSSMMGSASVFIIAFAGTALYLVKDTAERRVATRTDAPYCASTVGAAAVTPPRADGSRPADYEADDGLETRVASPLAQREVLSPLLFPTVPFALVAVFTLVVWRAPVAALVAGSVAALVGTLTWYAVPYLPSAAQLDHLAYRIVAFGFPIFTFGVIAGAIWAEEAWGRYWGWDPKETGSFFTWTLYAAYLHARSTHGWRGRRAAWIGVTAFVALMVTYYAVNLWVVGLHSYAGL
jgi:cytochrome c-type biogenesis protein CcsB